MKRQMLDERDLIMTLSGVLSPAECASYIERAEARGFAAAPITTAAGFVHRPDVRNNTRVMFDDEPLARVLWRRVEPEVPRELRGWRAIGLNERLRFYRYEAGQTFRWHYDGAFVRSAREQSLLSFLIYLSEGFTGGATEFDAGPTVEPRQGMALLFRHPVLHQGAAVLWGRKYVLRSDVMYQRGG